MVLSYCKFFKNYVLIFLFFIFIITGFSSSNLQIEPLLENFSEGETFIGEINVHFLEPLQKGDLKIFNEYGGEMLFEKNVFSYNNSSFVYIIFSKKGNYTIRIPEVAYTKEGGVFFDKIDQNVLISEKQNKTLSIKPGILVDQDLTLGNEGESPLSVTIQGLEYNLGPGDMRKIAIEYNSSFFYLDVLSHKLFKIPAISFNISLEDIKNPDEPIINGENNSSEDIPSFIVRPSEISLNVTSNETHTFSFNISNSLDKLLKINVSSPSSDLEFDESFELGPLEDLIFNMTLFRKHDGVFLSNVSFNSENFNTSVDINAIVLSDENKFDSFFSDDYNSENDTLCSDIGKVCGINEYCYGRDFKLVGGEVCCVGGFCELEEEDGPAKKSPLIWILALGGVCIVGFFIYKKFRGVKAKPKL